MRSTALIALLPLLATLATARPHDHHHGHKHDNGPNGPSGLQRQRKTLSFGPKHGHASFETIDTPVVPLGIDVGGLVDVDPKEVARAFIAHKIGGNEGESFYLREDTYTDPRTLITHIYARQLINGLEVSDGDINVNIDRDGRVLSWGNSFHPGPAPSAFDLDTSSDETEHVCEQLKATISAHKAELASLKGDEGAWGFVKAAAELVLGGLGGERKVTDEAQIRKVRKTLKHAKHHYKAVCKDDVTAASSDKMLAPVDALLALLPRVAVDHDLVEDLDHGDFASTPHHSLKPKAAPAEPPTEVISGPGLAKAGVLSDVPARLMYTQTSTGAPRMVWKLDVEMQHNWYEAYLDVATGELLRIVDWANDLSWDTPTGDNKVEVQKGGKQKPLPSPPKKLEPYTYQIFPWGVNDPLTGNLSVVTKPWDAVASPLGWHVIPTSANPWNGKIPGMNVTGNTTTFYTTVGNNVIAHEDWEGQNNYLLNYRPVNESMVFAYDYGESDGLAPKEYADMVITQLFYTSNMYHDLLYRLGFDEISGNFQVSNHGLGGKGGDPLIANAQDGSGYNK